MTDNFSQTYFPAFSTREHELNAYNHADSAAKDRMLPVVTLTREREASSLADSVASLAAAAGGRPVIVDFDPEPRPVASHEEIEIRRREKAAKRKAEGKKPFVPSPKQEERYRLQRENTIEFNRTLELLKSPAGGYAAWMALALSGPNFIPLAKLGDPAAALAQVMAVVAADRRIAFRLHLGVPGAVTAFLAAAAGLDGPSRSILILDAGYIRDSVSVARDRVIDALAEIRKHLSPPMFDGMVKVCMAGSFPSSLTNLPGHLRIQERDLFDLVKADWDVRYGDHASVQRRSGMEAASGWFPHVDVAHLREWHFDRSDKKSNSVGYVDAARVVKGKFHVWRGRSASWGTDMVERASRGMLNDGMGLKLTTPGPWVGVRVSQHLTHQAFHP
jgi:hypothetical protein